MLLVRGSVLPRASGGGYVIVFDDVTKLIQAQRATAWGEVARRLAHEIKNPLTPIQLSAERLQAKLANKLAPEDAADAQPRHQDHHQPGCGDERAWWTTSASMRARPHPSCRRST